MQFSIAHSNANKIEHNDIAIIYGNFKLAESDSYARAASAFVCSCS
jgi:hypothetical protein